MDLSPIEARDGGFALRLCTGMVLLLSVGCAGTPDSDLLIDPLKQRLIAREDIALQNLLFSRAPAYIPAGSGRNSSSSYLDAPYDGPAVEPPLPDLSLLPEDLPPWEQNLEPLPPVPDGSNPPSTPQPNPVPAATPEAKPTPQS